MITGSNKIANLNRYVPVHHTPQSVSHHIIKETSGPPVPVNLKFRRVDITNLLEGRMLAPLPKSPDSPRPPMLERFASWCQSLGRRDYHGNRRLARRFLKSLSRRG